MSTLYTSMKGYKNITFLPHSPQKKWNFYWKPEQVWATIYTTQGISSISSDPTHLVSVCGWKIGKCENYRCVCLCASVYSCQCRLLPTNTPKKKEVWIMLALMGWTDKPKLILKQSETQSTQRGASCRKGWGEGWKIATLGEAAQLQSVGLFL